MRHFSAANGVREHRLLHVMQEGPEAMPVAAVPVEQRILNEMQNMNERVNRFDLTKDRKDAVERQRKIIEAKFDDIQYRAKTENKEYQDERNALLREVDELVSYAEYQAAQEMENRKAGRSEHQEDRLQDVTVEESGGRRHIFIKAPANETMRFTYVSRSPEIARVLGVMTFDSRTVSMNMRGRFNVSRTKDKEGNHYFVITPDDVFDGTFTMYIGNEHKTVDWMNKATRQTMELQEKQRKERNETQSIESLEKDLKAAAAQLLDIATRIGNLKTEADIVRELPELQKQKKELEQRIADLRKKILEYRQRNGLTSGEPAPNRSLPLTNGMNASAISALPPEEAAREKRVQDAKAFVEKKETDVGSSMGDEARIQAEIKDLEAQIQGLNDDPDINQRQFDAQYPPLERALKAKRGELLAAEAKTRDEEYFLKTAKEHLEKLQRKEK